MYLMRENVSCSHLFLFILQSLKMDCAKVDFLAPHKVNQSACIRLVHWLCNGCSGTGALHDACVKFLVDIWNSHLSSAQFLQPFDTTIIKSTVSRWGLLRHTSTMSSVDHLWQKSDSNVCMSSYTRSSHVFFHNWLQDQFQLIIWRVWRAGLSKLCMANLWWLSAKVPPFHDLTDAEWSSGKTFCVVLLFPIKERQHVHPHRLNNLVQTIHKLTFPNSTFSVGRLSISHQTHLLYRWSQEFKYVNTENVYLCLSLTNQWLAVFMASLFTTSTTHDPLQRDNKITRQRVR